MSQMVRQTLAYAAKHVKLANRRNNRAGNSKYLKGELIYEKEQDRFRCPLGKYLNPSPAIIENHKRYATLSEDCR